MHEIFEEIDVRSIRRCMDEDLEVVKDVWNVL